MLIFRERERERSHKRNRSRNRNRKQSLTFTLTFTTTATFTATVPCQQNNSLNFYNPLGINNPNLTLSPYITILSLRLWHYPIFNQIDRTEISGGRENIAKSCKFQGKHSLSWNCTPNSETQRFAIIGAIQR